MTKITETINSILDEILCEELAQLKLTKIKEAASSERFSNADENFDNFLPITLGTRSLFELNEGQLAAIRQFARIVVPSDEVAKNVVKHYQNHIVGAGLSLTIFPTDVGQDPEKLANFKEDSKILEIKQNWKAFCAVNKFNERLLNWVERNLRDGETIIRIFASEVEYGGLKVPTIRFIDPADLTQDSSTPNSDLGVITDPNDVETILGFTVTDGNGGFEKVPVEEVIFDKRNNDINNKRGISSFWPVFTDLRRINKNLVNVSVLTAIQSSIALIRKHSAGKSPSQIEKMIARNSDQQRTKISGKTQYSKQLGPGTVLDTPETTEYEFPAHSVNSENFIKVIDKELAHVALNFVLPISWLKSEEPTNPLGLGSATMKNFQTEQSRYYSYVEELFWRVQIMMGTVQEEDRLKYLVRFFGPTLGLDKALDQARVEEIAIRNGASSPQTYAAKMGNDYTVERSQMIQHRKTAQPNEVMPGDSGNTNITPDQKASGQGGDGLSKAGGGQRGAGGK